MARLFVLSGNFIGSTFDFEETSTVGRGDDADIVIAEASISRKHARMVPRAEPGHWKVVDLDSSNGVFVGGKRVRSGIVADGDTFRLGEVELRLRDAAAEEDEDGASIELDDFVDDDSFDDEGDDDGDGFELEFGDDLDEKIATSAPPVERTPTAPREAPRRQAAPLRSAEGAATGSGSGAASKPAARAGARATADRAQRRQEALRGAGAPASNPNPSGGSKPVLQYSAANQRSSGVDLSQLSGGMRALVLLLALALMGGIAYGAFTLTRTARDQSAALSD
ncbi:MAG: FHA domain-containing protein [Planctomycetota bacterium]